MVNLQFNLNSSDISCRKVVSVIEFAWVSHWHEGAGKHNPSIFSPTVIVGQENLPGNLVALHKYCYMGGFIRLSTLMCMIITRQYLGQEWAFEERVKSEELSCVAAYNLMPIYPAVKTLFSPSFWVLVGQKNDNT